MPEPGLSVVTASRLEPLRDRLAATFREAPLAPLDRETIVVARNVGLRRYLERELARSLGVAASLDLRSPRDLTATLAKQLIPSGTADDFRTHPFETSGLAWRIRDLLGVHAGDPVYARVRVYLDRAALRGEAEFGLATRLAELFDTYQVYRPETLAAWEAGDHHHPDWPDEPWQADLWRRLTDEAETQARGIDRATHLRRLIDRLTREDDLAVPLSRVSVFGALVFPPFYWRVLGALARHVPVTVYTVVHGLGAHGLSAHELATDPYAPREARHPLLRDLGGRADEWLAVLRDLGAPPVEHCDASSTPLASSTASPARRRPPTSWRPLRRPLLHRGRDREGGSTPPTSWRPPARPHSVRRHAHKRATPLQTSVS